MNARILMSVRRILTKVQNYRTDRIQLQEMLKKYPENKYNTMGKIKSPLVSLMDWWPSRQWTTKEKESCQDALKENWKIISKCLYNVLRLTVPWVAKKLLIKSLLTMLIGAPVDTAIGLKFFDYICECLSTIDLTKACDIVLLDRILQYLFEVGKKLEEDDTPDVDTEKDLSNNVDGTEPTLQDLEQQLKNDLEELKSKYDVPEKSQPEQ